LNEDVPGEGVGEEAEDLLILRLLDGVHRVDDDLVVAFSILGVDSSCWCRHSPIEEPEEMCSLDLGENLSSPQEVIPPSKFLGDLVVEGDGG
jgi:hypothetical protein